MKVLITGANGFIAKNLRAHLSERQDTEVSLFTRNQSAHDLVGLVQNVNFIFHLAGVNRPKNFEEFEQGNADLTRSLCSAIEASGNSIPVVFGSSIQAELNNPYGKSKLAAEQALLALEERTGNPIYLFRLPNVFGKWCKPNYNSVVATFCHNIARDIKVEISDSTALISLAYIDDVINRFISIVDGAVVSETYCNIDPVYEITVGELVSRIMNFRISRSTLVTERVGTGFARALHSTYLSYLPPDDFSYDLVKHVDMRGEFVEMLKTKDSGQFSYFLAHPGVTRGGHYHHSKTEKFLVIRGEAMFRFRHIMTDEYYELKTSSREAVVVETVPGWTHDITNIGNDDMIVMLWANEAFDKNSPDTFVRAL